MRAEYEDPFDLLEERHVLSLILYLSGKENVTKGQIYTDISRGNRMPDKLTALERYGIIDMTFAPGTSRAYIQNEPTPDKRAFGPTFSNPMPGPDEGPGRYLLADIHTRKWTSLSIQS